jgi:hypothetical protein
MTLTLDLFCLLHTLLWFSEMGCNIPYWVTHRYALELEVMLPYEIFTVTAIFMRQESIDNASQDVETKITRARIRDPAFKVGTGDGCQVSGTGKNISDSILSIRVSMLGLKNNRKSLQFLLLVVGIQGPAIEAGYL